LSAPTPVPVVFVHGLWLHATSWTPWMELFAAHGHSMGADSGWAEIADTALDFLYRNGVGTPSGTAPGLAQS
jgi:hypothetical protein